MGSLVGKQSKGLLWSIINMSIVINSKLM